MKFCLVLTRDDDDRPGEMELYVKGAGHDKFPLFLLENNLSIQVFAG